MEESKPRKKRRKRPNKGTKAYEQWQKRVEGHKTLAEWSQAVQKRDGYACIICGAVAHVKMKDGVPVIGKKSKRQIIIPLHSHHLLRKEDYKHLSRKRMNGICICPGCHKYKKESAHGNPIFFTLWLRKNRPDQYHWVKEQLKIMNVLP